MKFVAKFLLVAIGLVVMVAARRRSQLLSKLRTYQIVHIRTAGMNTVGGGGGNAGEGGIHFQSNAGYPASTMFEFDHPTDRENDGSVRLLSVSLEQNTELMGPAYREMRTDYDTSGKLV